MYVWLMLLSCWRVSKVLRIFNYYSDSKCNQIVFFFPLTLHEFKIAFSKSGFSFADLFEMSKEEINKTKFGLVFSVVSSNV